MSITMYEKVGGVASVATEVNWKNSTDSSHLYYFYPLKRPVVDSTHKNYMLESDLASSYHKVNYFRVTGATKITDPRIIICSSNKTKIRYYFDADMEPHIVYGGSGYADGIEYDESVGVRAYIKDGIEYYEEWSKKKLEGNEAALAAFGNETETAEIKYLRDHLFVKANVCIRINIMTGAADKVRVSSAAAAPEMSDPTPQPDYSVPFATENYSDFEIVTNTYLLAGDGAEEPGTEVTGDLKATRTYLYAGITNDYTEPSNSFLHNLKFVSSGNMVIPVPLSTSPELATTYQEEYTGGDLYTPYLNTQLHVANSTFEDVGNSPSYRIVFMCKIFN